MTRRSSIGFYFFIIAISFAQNTSGQKKSLDFISIKSNPATIVKNQENTGTCWSFSTTSLIESQALQNNFGNFDLSEMFTVRNIYVEKAKNYIHRQGHAQFSEGGLGHDVIRSVAAYGILPESAYAGLANGQKTYDHGEMFKKLKGYLDRVIATAGTNPISSDWLPEYNKILDTYLGILPERFQYNNKAYTPIEFSSEVLKFKAEDYVNITSFTDHDYYKPFIIEVPDNFSNGAYYNMPLKEMISLAENAIENGYTVLWDADVSNNGFRSKKGLALYLNAGVDINEDDLKADVQEEKWDAQIRQDLYENLTTQDDHLMHIVGLEKTNDGKLFFLVKNSWGKNGPYQGYINVSEAYFAINTISLVVPKAAMNKVVLDKLKIGK